MAHAEPLLDSYPRNPDTKRPRSDPSNHVQVPTSQGLQESFRVEKNRKESIGIEPQGLNVPQAAAYYGISPKAYRQLMRRGAVPGPIKISGFERHIIDKVQLDAVLDALSKGAA